MRAANDPRVSPWREPMCEYPRTSPVGRAESMSRTAESVSRVASRPRSGQGREGGRSAGRAPIGARRPAGDPLENVREMRGVREAQTRGDRLELVVGVRQKVLGDRHPDSGEIVADAHPDLRAKEMGQVARRDVGELRDALDRQLLIVVLAQMSDGATHELAE